MREHVKYGIIGALAGAANGLFGAGGGLFLVPLFIGWTYTAGGINLLYFTGCAPAALVSHIRNKRIVWRAVLPCLLTGVPLSVLAALVSGTLDVTLLHKAFGVVLLYIGIKELFTKAR